MTTAAPPPIIVSVAPRADSRVWKQQQTDWPGYLEAIRLTNPANHKECGGLLPAALRNTTRNNDAVVARYVATLDADSADLDLPDAILDLLPGTVLAWHTTWRHTLANPRYRVHIPFSREVTPAEYQRVARSLIRFLGAESFDATTSTQPAQFAWLASTSDPATYEFGTQDGDLLNPDHWLGDPDDDLRRPSVSLEEDDAAPTPAQIDKATTILHKYEWEVKNLKEKATGASLDGRNIALISRLPTLFRFVLSGCLDEQAVLDSMWYAVTEAPGDHAFERKEFETVVARARKYAEDDGPGKPTVVDDFTTPLPDDPDTDDTTTPTLKDFTPDERLDVLGIIMSAARWTPNRVLEIERLARFLIDRLGLAVAEEDDRASGAFWTYWNGVWREDGEEVLRGAIARIFGNTWKKTTENAVIGFLTASTLVPILPSESSAPHLINLANGMYDINTQTLIPWDPAYSSRVKVPHPFEPNASCPAFDAFLADVLRPDQIPVMWEALGYSLYSPNPLHRAFLLHGPTGRNGKSTLLDVVGALVGRENASLLSLSQLNEHRFLIPGLRGRLVNIAGEQEAGKMPTALVKQLISSEPITADRKGISPITFAPTATQWVATNNSITSRDSSDALANRFVIFEFGQSFYGREDTTLLQRLTTQDELQGIVAHALSSLRDLLARKSFDLSETMLADRNEYAAAMGGSVREFVHTYIETETDNEVKGSDLWNAYQNSCLLDNVKNPLGKNGFYRALLGDPRFTRLDKGDRTAWFKGIRLVGDPDGAQSDFL